MNENVKFERKLVLVEGLNIFQSTFEVNLYELLWEKIDEQMFNYLKENSRYTKISIPLKE